MPLGSLGLRFLLIGLRLLAQPALLPLRTGRPQCLECTGQNAERHDHDKRRGCRETKLVPSDSLLKLVPTTGRARGDGLGVEMPKNVGGQPVDGLIAPVPLLLQTLHHNPVQIAFDRLHELMAINVSGLGCRGKVSLTQGVEAC